MKKGKTFGEKYPYLPMIATMNVVGILETLASGSPIPVIIGSVGTNATYAGMLYLMKKDKKLKKVI